MTWSLIKNRDNYNFTLIILFFLFELYVLLAMNPRIVPVTGKLSGIRCLLISTWKYTYSSRDVPVQELPLDTVLLCTALFKTDAVVTRGRISTFL
jgi:hypothetical protein